MSSAVMTTKALYWDEGSISDETFRTKLTTLPEIIGSWVEKYGGLAGKDVLDFGCGHAITALGIALRHPGSRVVGIDINSDPGQCVSLARDQLRLERLPDNLSLHQVLPGQLHDNADRFDLIYSWSVFEHVEQRLLAPTLRLLRAKLRRNGLLFIQIAPLYYSVNGSHLMDLIAEPWGHLLNQHSLYLEKLEKAADPTGYSDLRSMFETLNKLTAAGLLSVVKAAGFKVLREYRTENIQPIPPELAGIYQTDVLLTEQIVLLMRPEAS
jgi:SAM-dependent methyltransferase